jgi:P2-related tail formation protein
VPTLLGGDGQQRSAVASRSMAMEEEDALLTAVRDARNQLLQGSDDNAEPAAASILALVQADASLQGHKVTIAAVKKAMREARRRVEVEEWEPPAPEPTRHEPTQRAIDANGGLPPANPFDTAAVECRVSGDGVAKAAVRHEAEFLIEARDATGQRRTSGGDAFFVAIRGASRVRARVTDNEDGTYGVLWKPPQSGAYEIAVSYFGHPLPGSPYQLHATKPVPYAPNCIVRGGALNNAVARASQSFQVSFKDRLGNVRMTPS